MEKQNVKQIRKQSPVKMICIILVVSLSCIIFAGCGHKLSGKYTSESGYYAVKFSYNGSCTWYQSGSFFDGTYSWDNDDKCYYLEMRGNGLYMNTTFMATPTSGGLIIRGGTVNNELFTKGG